MLVSIVIPVYNEKNTILNLLQRVKNSEIGNFSKEIIVVDDGSTDRTAWRVKNYIHRLKRQQKKAVNHGTHGFRK